MAKFPMGPYLCRWVERRAATHVWRMPNWITEDDLVQEARINWQVVNEKYDEAVTEIAHMVALFKTTFQRSLIDLARNPKNPGKLETSLDAIVESVGDLTEMVADEGTSTLIAEAPEPVKSILGLLTADEGRILCPPFRHYLDGSRDTANNRLHRALKRRGIEVDSKADLLTIARDYIQPRRIRLFDEPTLVDLVSAMVDSYLTPEPKSRQRLHYPPNLVSTAKAKVKSHLKPRPRNRMFPVVEKVDARRQRCTSKGQRCLDYTQGRVRQRTPDPQPREQVSQHPRTQVRSRVHGDWRDCQYAGRQQRGDGGRLRGPEADHDRLRCGTVGPCAPAVGQGPHGGRLPQAASGPQDMLAAVHPHGGEPGGASGFPLESAAGTTQPEAHSREALRDA